MSKQKADRAQSESGKRPYHSPTLLVYGDVNKLTHAQAIFSFKPLDGRVTMVGPITLQWRS